MITAAPIDSKIVAAVNGTPIYDEEVKLASHLGLQLTEDLAEPERSKRRQEIAHSELTKLIERELMVSQAWSRLQNSPEDVRRLIAAAGTEFDKHVRGLKERAKAHGFDIDSDEDLAHLTERQGVSLSLLRRHIERGFVAMEYMRHLLYPVIESNSTPEAVRHFYDQNRERFPAWDEEAVKRTLRKELADQEYKRIVDEMRQKATVQIMSE